LSKSNSSIGSKEISDTSEPEVETIPFLEGGELTLLQKQLMDVSNLPFIF